jgi:hypothetical protein
MGLDKMTDENKEVAHCSFPVKVNRIFAPFNDLLHYEVRRFLYLGCFLHENAW